MSLFDIRTSHAFPCLTLESLQNEELSVPSTISTSNRETRGRSLRQTGTSISGCRRQTGKSVRNGQPCPHIVLRRSRLHVAGCGVDVTYTRGGWGLAHRASVRDQRAKQWFQEVPLGTWSSWEDEAFTFQPNSGGPCDVTGCRALL